LGLASGSNGLILSYGTSSNPNSLQLKSLSPNASGDWTATDTYSETLPSTLSNDVAILSFNGNSGPGLIFAGVNTQAKGYGVQTSFSTIIEFDNSWSTPSQLVQRVESNGIKFFPAITATAAPSLTWLDQDAVLAVNDGGSVNVYAAIPNSLSWQLASSFSAASSEPAISTAPVLATTDTGLALTYGATDGTVTLQRLNLLDAQGNILDGEQPWITTTINQANGGLSSNLATVPLSINGNLLLTNVRSDNSEIWLNAVPNLGNPASTTWLNTTVQLASNLSQRSGAEYSVGGLGAGAWQDVSSGASPSVASLANYGDTVYMAVRGTNNNLFFTQSNNNGQSWNNWQGLPSAMGTYTSPSIAYYNGMLYLCYVAAGSNDLNITSYDGANNTWSKQYQISGQSATAASLVVEGNNLAVYFISNDSSDRILKAYTSTSSPSSTDWSETSVLYGDSSNQTASSNLAVTRYNGQTYVAYQGGTSSSPSSDIYITTASDSVANGSAPNWGFAPIPNGMDPLSKGLGLTSNSQGLLLTYTDSSAPDQVTVHMSDAEVTGWLALENSSILASNVAYTPFITASSTNPLLIAGIATSEDIYVQQNQLNTTTLTSQQTGSTISAVGDINGDGLDDLVVSANNVAFAPNGDFNSTDTELVTGVRFVLGAGSAESLINNNSVTASEQSVQIASLYTNSTTSSSTPVAARIGKTQLSLNGLQAGAASQIVSSDGAPLSTSSITATAGSPSSLQQLFDGTSSKALAATYSSSSNGILSLQTLTGYGDLNGDGYIDYLAADGLDYVATASGTIDFSVWSIRAAGDVNGNGLDDVLLTLAPRGPAYVAAADGSPTALASVLVDGALFRVDTTNNTFSLANLKNPLNPFNSGEIYDVTSTSNNQYSPLLQNWFQPIDLFEPGNVTGVSKGTVLNITTAMSFQPPVGVVNNAGALTLVFPGQPSGSRKNETGSGVWFAYQSPPGTWQQAQISNTSTANWNQPASAAYFGGKLYVAWVDTSSNMHISYTSAYQDNGDPADYASSVWTTYGFGSGQSTDYAPTLVAEEGRLALYFPSDTSKTSVQYVRYMYSSDPDSASNWGSVLAPATAGSTAPSSYTNNQSALLGSFETSSVISATTYQGRTVLAFYNGSTAYLATAPSANPQPDATWDSYSISSLGELSGISLSTDQSLLYLTASQYYPSTASSVYSLQPTTPGKYTTYSKSNASSGPNSFQYDTSLNTVLLDGQLYATYVNSSNQVELVPLDVTVSAPGQQSLSGYSVDGNIDVNGDGFTDVLLSDPSDPKEGLDNQYVLFGGDYLDIASQVGTAGNDTLIGTPLADVIYTLSGADEVRSNGGADVIYTASGNDQISIKDNAFLRIDAGAGFDQLLLEGNANQAFDFSLNASIPEYFFGSKLRNIELINSQDFGSNVITLDAAAVNAANPDRVLFLVPDAGDSIQLSSEFERNSGFDTSYAGALWYAYTAGTAVPGSSNPTLVYVGVPVGESASDWLASNVQTVDASVSVARMATPFALNQSESSINEPSVPSASSTVGSASFGDGLVISAYSTTPSSGVARFQITRTGDLSRSQLVSYVSSSLNSSAEPGRHYTPAVGLLRLEAGQDAADITVPVDGAAIAALRNGTLSLQVAELDDRGQQEIHLLLDVNPASGGLRPVLSDLDLQVDDTGALATIGFRADTNKGALREDLATTLNLNVRRRLSADRASNDQSNRLQTLSISDGLLAKFDQDRSDDDQVNLEFVLNTITGSIQLQAAQTALNPLILSKLDPTRTAITVGVELTTTSLDAIPVATPPPGVLLNQTAIDFTVDADSTGKAKLFLDLTQVGDDLDLSVLKDGVLKRKENTQLLYYGIDEDGALSPLTYNARHKAGARFYDTDGDTIADFVSFTFVDGGIGDTGPKGDGKIHDPSTAGTVDLQNVVLTAVDSRILQASDQVNKVAPASLVLRAGLNGRSATTNQIYYLVHDLSEPIGLDSIFADLNQLKERSQTLYTSLESTDVTLAPGTSLTRDILLINGQHISFFEVVDGTLDQLTSATDQRLRVFTNSGLSSGGSRSGNLSSTSGVSLAVSLVAGDQGLGALIGQEQGLAPVLDFTAFTADQTIEGTLTLAREAAFDAVTGFYRTLDLQGTVWSDPFDQSKGKITPGQVGTTAADYGAAALRNMVDGLTGLQVGNRQTSNRSISIQGGSYLAPIAQVKGNTFVAFAGGNADNISHFVSVGSNMFGFEDLYGGGDRDFDDKVFGFAFTKLVTPAA
jgi:hypothetical protein